MKRERLPLHALIICVFLAALVSFSGVMCLNDAFLLEADSRKLLLCCCGSSLLAALAMWPRRCWPQVLGAAALLLLGIYLRFDTLLASLDLLMYQITGVYAPCFSNVQILGEPGGDPFPCLLVLGILLSWITAWASSREGSVLFVPLACLPVLILCLMVIEIAPVLWLILLTGGLMLLILSHSVRERNPADGGLLIWWLIAPTSILLCVITILWPPADYVRADWSQTLQSTVSEPPTLTELPEVFSSPLPGWNRSLKTVDLSRLGPKKMTGKEALQYRSDEPISYLRGVSLGIYEDNAWKAVSQSTYAAQKFQTEPLIGIPSGGSALILELMTKRQEPLLYTTYYLHAIPETGTMIDDAYVRNTGGTDQYEVRFGTDSGVMPADYDFYAQDQYTQLPPELVDPLLDILMEQGLIGASAHAIADYVRRSAVYDLNTPSIPAGEDFVLYFLRERNQGYCVHFASAAVLLLRANGIPARYVTGYAVSGSALQWNSVTEDEAHAWVEYYVNGIGWLPLDPTPADTTAVPDTEQPPAQDPPTQPQPEEPPEAAPEEDPTEPPTDKPSSPSAVPGQKPPFPTALLWLLLLPATVFLFWLRRQIGLRYRRDRCGKGHPNRRALAWWRWLVQLSHATGSDVPEDLLCLAEKARFSQHTLTEEELSLLEQAVQIRIRSASEAPFLRRLWDQYGLVLY